MMKNLRKKLYKEALKYKENKCNINEQALLEAFSDYTIKYCSEALKKKLKENRNKQ